MKDLTCATCAHFQKTNNEASCYAHPPRAVTMAGAPTTKLALAQGSISMSTVAVYPPVREDTPACGEYVPATGPDA